MPARGNFKRLTIFSPPFAGRRVNSNNHPLSLCHCCEPDGVASGLKTLRCASPPPSSPNQSQMLPPAAARLPLIPPPTNGSGPGLLPPSPRSIRGSAEKRRALLLSPPLPLSPSRNLRSAASHGARLLNHSPAPALRWTEGDCWPCVCSAGAAARVW